MRKRMAVVLLVIVCALPLHATAAAPDTLLCLPSGIELAVMDEYAVNGDLDVAEMKYDYHTQSVYRPITYVTHYADGSVKETRIEAKQLLTVTYTYYYGKNKYGEYVFAGGNPVPTLGNFVQDIFAVEAQHVMKTSCNAVQLPNFAGYTYTFSGGYFTMDYYDVIHLDEAGNIIRKELNLGQGIAYHCTFTIP